MEQFDEADLLTGTLDSLLAEISTHTERCRHLEEQELEGSITASGDSAVSIEVIRTAQVRENGERVNEEKVKEKVEIRSNEM